MTEVWRRRRRAAALAAFHTGCFAGWVTFWREVFDLSERADTPARAKAAVQVGVVLMVVGVAGFLVVQGLSERTSPVAMALLSMAMAGTGLTIGSYRHLRRLRRQRKVARAEARRRRIALPATAPERPDPPG